MKNKCNFLPDPSSIQQDGVDGNGAVFWKLRELEVWSDWRRGLGWEPGATADHATVRTEHNEPIRWLRHKCSEIQTWWPEVTAFMVKVRGWALALSQTPWRRKGLGFLSFLVLIGYKWMCHLPGPGGHTACCDWSSVPSQSFSVTSAYSFCTNWTRAHWHLWMNSSMCRAKRQPNGARSTRRHLSAQVGSRGLGTGTESPAWAGNSWWGLYWAQTPRRALETVRTAPWKN